MNELPGYNRIGMRGSTKAEFQSCASAELVSEPDFAELTLRAWKSLSAATRERIKRRLANEKSKRGRAA